MKMPTFSTIVFLFVLICSCTAVQTSAPPERVRFITKESLAAIIDDPGIFVLDARYGRDWKRAQRKIKNAVRIETDEIDSWEGRYPASQKIVIYCS